MRLSLAVWGAYRLDERRPSPSENGIPFHSYEFSRVGGSHEASTSWMEHLETGLPQLTTKWQELGQT